MVITEERNWRFAAADEAGLEKWLGAIKSVVARRKEGEIRERAVSGASAGGATDGKKDNVRGEQGILRAEGKSVGLGPASGEAGGVKSEGTAQPQAVPIR